MSHTLCPKKTAGASQGTPRKEPGRRAPRVQARPGSRRAPGARRRGGGGGGGGAHSPSSSRPPRASRSRAPARSALSAARCPVRSGTFGNFRRALAAIFSPLVCLAGCVARFL